MSSSNLNGFAFATLAAILEADIIAYPDQNPHTHIEYVQDSMNSRIGVSVYGIPNRPQGNGNAVWGIAALVYPS